MTRPAPARNAERLMVVGAGGHGKVVADAARLAAAHRELAFFDDRFPELQTAGGHWPVIGKLEDIASPDFAGDEFVVAIGDNRRRLQVQDTLIRLQRTLATIIHPAAIVSSYARIGRGSVVFAGAVINVDAQLGEACIVNTAASIDHDCVLGRGVHLSPGVRLGGGVRIGNASWVGIGAVVRQDIEIGADVVVGAGAAVVSDVASGLTVLGVPAKARSA